MGPVGDALVGAELALGGETGVATFLTAGLTGSLGASGLGFEFSDFGVATLP
jgi:hypothetical protein